MPFCGHLRLVELVVALPLHLVELHLGPLLMKEFYVVYEVTRVWGFRVFMFRGLGF